MFIYFEVDSQNCWHLHYLKGRNFGGKKFWRFDQSAKLIAIWRILFWRMRKRTKFGGNLFWRMAEKSFLMDCFIYRKHKLYVDKILSHQVKIGKMMFTYHLKGNKHYIHTFGWIKFWPLITKLKLAGINFGGSVKYLYLAERNFGGIFKNPPNPPKFLTAKISSLKVICAFQLRYWPFFQG